MSEVSLSGTVEVRSAVFTNGNQMLDTARIGVWIARRADVRVIRLHYLRHTHGTLLIAAGVPVKVVSERLGHGHPAFTIETYQHVLPGMQAHAAQIFERLVVPGLLPTEPSREKTRENTA